VFRSRYRIATKETGTLKVQNPNLVQLSFSMVLRTSASLIVTWVLSVLLATNFVMAAEHLDPKRWEKDIQKFEEAEKTQPVEPGGIVFVGSSSIRMWDLTKAFPGLPVVNRGFGGSHLADSVAYLDRLVVKHRPRLVVLYAGDNDIQHGLSSEQVVEDYRRFVDALHRALPDTRIVYIPIKPSVARWEKYPQMAKANRAIRAIIDESPFQDYLAIEEPMLNTEGVPNPALFQEDGLHLNEAGYQIWTELLRPLLSPESRG
jgi:lysophospholipase L1-like esterase